MGLRGIADVGAEQWDRATRKTRVEKCIVTAGFASSVGRKGFVPYDSDKGPGTGF